MATNLTGVSKKIGELKSKLKRLGIDVESIAPRGYTGLDIKSQQKILNNLNKAKNNYINKTGNTLQGTKRKKFQTRIKKETPKKIEERLLKEINDLRNSLGLGRGRNAKLMMMEAHPAFLDINNLLWYFDKYKGDITHKEFAEVAKNTKIGGKRLWKNQNSLLSTISDKLAPIKIEYYIETLKYYGFKNKEMKYFKAIYKNMNLESKNNILNVLNDFMKGQEKYDSIGNDDIDHSFARDNFQRLFDLELL